jgi:arsenite methyltransferase
MTFFRERMLSTVARQLGRPHGLLSPLVARALNGGAVHGIEVSDDMLSRARSRFGYDVASGRLRLASGSLTELPLDDDSVDAAITVNTVYFTTELGAACAELARVVRPGGRIVIGIGDPDVMAQMPFTPHGFTIRPVAEIAGALANSGFQVEQRRMDEKPMPRYLFVGRPAA